MTHGDSNRCQRIPAAGGGERQTAEVRPSEEDGDNGSFYFSTAHSSGRKAAWLPACCLNPKPTSSSCLGHGISQSHCQFVHRRCNVTTPMFFFQCVFFFFFYNFALINNTGRHLCHVVGTCDRQNNCDLTDVHQSVEKGHSF